MLHKMNIVTFGTALLLFGETVDAGAANQPPVLEARAVDLLESEGISFKDLNKNGKLDVYEDWRKTVDRRVNDLLSQMTLEEKAGMLLIDTLNAERYGRMSDKAVQFVQDEKMTRSSRSDTV